MQLDTSDYIFIDHHAHSILKSHLDLDVLAFRQCFTETRSVLQLNEHLPWSLHYRDFLRQLGQLLVVDGEEAIIQFRSSRSVNAYTKLIWDKASIGALLIDDGYKKASKLDLPALAKLCGRPVYLINRIETVIEELLLTVETFQELLDSFESKLVSPRGVKMVALKTIAAYRGGLNINVYGQTQAKTDFNKLKRVVAQEGKVRIANRPLYHFLLAEAFAIAGRHQLPVQVHTGMGDDDALLMEANPACMQPILKSKAYRQTKFVFLHCYPYVREAAYLAAIYANAYVDLSSSMQLASPVSSQMLRELIAQAPLTKILAASDGHSIPEAHWWGAFCWRRSLNSALGALVAESYLNRTDAEQAAELMLSGNARRLYNLEDL